MSGAILMVVVPGGLAPVLGTALSVHPSLDVRDGVAVGRLHAELDAHTRARVHSDKMPWDTGSDWVDELVATQLERVTRGAAGRRPVWRSHDPGDAQTLARLLDATPLVWVGDGRHALAAPPPDVDPIEAAVQAGGDWGRAARITDALPGAVRITPSTPPADVLAALGLDRHAPTEQALGMLRSLGAPRLPPARSGAFAADPNVARRLAEAGARVDPAPDHPAVHAARARAAADAQRPHDAIALAHRALASTPTPRVRSAAISVLLAAGDEASAVHALERWRRDADHPEAWSALLALADHPAGAAVASAARRHPNPTVRGALARWLVANGLDRQAAEAVCRVRDTDWFAPLDAAPPPEPR